MSGAQRFTGPGVVFADDGQPASDVAWAWLTSHQWGGWELQILTVRWTLLGSDLELKPSALVPRRAPQECGWASAVHVEVAGDPRVVLLDRSDPALLVLGSHRRSHVAGVWAGSTSEWLLMHPPAPVLLARHGYPTRSVAFCVDGSPHAQRALQAFWALPWSAEVAVTLVSVDDGSTEVEEALRLARSSLPAGIGPAKVERLSGSPRRALVDYVRANRLDLVVMGTRGLSGLTRMRVGSTVSALLKDGPANLMIAHVPDGRSAAEA